MLLQQFGKARDALHKAIEEYEDTIAIAWRAETPGDSYTRLKDQLVELEKVLSNSTEVYMQLERATPTLGPY